MLQKIQETAEFLRGKMTTAPETAIILGTGLGSLVNEITDKYEIQKLLDRSVLYGFCSNKDQIMEITYTDGSTATVLVK